MAAPGTPSAPSSAVKEPAVIGYPNKKQFVTPAVAKLSDFFGRHLGAA